MKRNLKTYLCAVAFFAAGAGTAFLVPPGTSHCHSAPALVTTKVVSWSQARVHKAGWGEMRTFFRGETAGTKNVLVAVAVVKPGQAVHRAHRHVEEEYLVIARGSGMWSVKGKEFPAKAGDVLFVEPWTYHGVTNTGSEDLLFAVFRYNSKGIQLPPKPDDRPDEL